MAAAAEPKRGLDTGNNERFVRNWWEVPVDRTAIGCSGESDARRSKARWFPFNKGGKFRKWYGNQELVVNWEDGGSEIRDDRNAMGARPQNVRFYFMPTISWTRITSSEPSFRFYPRGSIFSSNGPSLYTESGDPLDGSLGAILNSTTVQHFLKAIAPTMDFQAGQIREVPLIRKDGIDIAQIAESLTDMATQDWESLETSNEFTGNALLTQSR